MFCFNPCEDMIFNILSLMGSDPFFYKLPLWLSQWPQPGGKTFRCQALLGGNKVMQGCFRLDPCRRFTAQDVAQSLDIWRPGEIRLLRVASRHEFAGCRGRFSILLGELNKEVLAYLQDAAVEIGNHALSSQLSSLQASAPDHPRRAAVFGRIGSGAPPVLKGQKLSSHFPEKLTNFVQMLKEKNHGAFDRLDTVLRRILRLRSQAPDTSTNHFLQEDSKTWFGAAASVHFETPTRTSTKTIGHGAHVLHAEVVIGGERPGDLSKRNGRGQVSMLLAVFVLLISKEA